MTLVHQMVDEGAVTQVQRSSLLLMQVSRVMCHVRVTAVTCAA